MAQPTLPQFAGICLQTIFENWQNYYSPALQNVKSYFKMLSDIEGQTLDANTLYCIESPSMEAASIANIVALNVFDEGFSWIGEMTIVPIDNTLVAQADIDGVVYNLPIGAPITTIPGYYSFIDTGITLTNCRVTFANGAMICSKA